MEIPKLFKLLRRSLSIAVRKLAVQPLIELELDTDLVKRCEDTRARLVAEFIEIDGLKRLDRDIINMAALMLSIAREKPIVFRQDDILEEEGRRENTPMLTAFVNSVFAFYAACLSMGLDIGSIPAFAMKPIILFLSTAANMNRPDLTAVWLLAEAWTRKRLFGAGYRWTSAVSKPYYLASAA